jgi:hypothetical protein
MLFYRRIFPLINAYCPFLLETQVANLALLIGAILTKRSLCLTTLAKAFPIPQERQVANPKHELLHRLKRLSRFLDNERVDPVAVQTAFIPTIVARLGSPRWLGLLIDWTSFDTTLPQIAGGGRRKYQVLTIAVPRCGRALPLLTLAYERDKMPARGSQNLWEQEALAAVLKALPQGVRPIVIGDRAFGRAGLIEWLQARKVDYVLRLKRGAMITQSDGGQWKLGEEGTRRGEQRWVGGVRYGTYHDRPRDLWINLACSWVTPRRTRKNKKGKEYKEPWYLATSLGSLGCAVAWYRQRMWIEETFKDFHSGFGLDAVQVGSGERLGRLVTALSLAVALLHLLALPQVRVLPPGWAKSVVTYGRASLVSLALDRIDYLGDLPPEALPLPSQAA